MEDSSMCGLWYKKNLRIDFCDKEFDFMGLPKKICMKISSHNCRLAVPLSTFKALFNNLFNNFFLNYFSNKTFGFTNKLVDQYAGSLISSYLIHSQSHLLVDHMQFVEQDIYIIDVL